MNKNLIYQIFGAVALIIIAVETILWHAFWM